MTPEPPERARSAASRPSSSRASAPPSPERTIPLGRTALWWCAGLSAGMLLGTIAGTAAVVAALLASAAGLPMPAGWAAAAAGEAARWSDLSTVAPVRVALALAPLALTATAAALLLAGLRAQPRAQISRASALRLLRSGRPAVAKIVQVRRAARSDARGRVDVSLFVRGPSGTIYGTRVLWTLDPVDAESLRRGGIVPVRLDPQAPRRVAFDTRADLRDALGDADPETAFGPGAHIRAFLRRTRRTSLIVLACGLAAGLAVGVFG